MAIIMRDFLSLIMVHIIVMYENSCYKMFFLALDSKESNISEYPRWKLASKSCIICVVIADKRYISLEKDKDAQCFRKEAMSGDTAWYKIWAMSL
ncbi:hypothetical protein H5410_046912 [Solanum commersonii]|uniref:Uncharacterized protein n=1 Tax=Solanum commersonii TaxID=4109 RepID=A0A9J5XH46_SOLCO|nr:hypothetical protein H5410_046912 [Solanum commersonii]